MNAQVLIDAFVRQTMVLIAEVATSQGHRAPLAQVADEVFRQLTEALEEQGVRRKVVADMFGMALRSYQQKVQRLRESATESGHSLWEAIQLHLTEGDVFTRSDLMVRFAGDDPASVAAVLEDMVESGLVYRTGRGDGAVYRVAGAEELARAASNQDAQAHAAMVWATVYRTGPLSEDQLAKALKLSSTALRRALDDLLATQRVQSGTADDGTPTYSSNRLFIPLGQSAGFEAGLIDHYQAIVGAICAKLRNGTTRALPDDQLGGSTFTFDVWDGHPYEAEVRESLADHRKVLSELWDRVSEHNANGKPDEFSRVSFYCGQSVTDEGDAGDESGSDSVGDEDGS